MEYNVNMDKRRKQMEGQPMDMRDKIAEVLEISMDNVNDMDVTFGDFAAAGADAILEALPDIIASLHDNEISTDRVKYKTDLSSAWDRLEAAFEEVDSAVGERLDSMIPLKDVNRELEGILKSIIKNKGQMTPMQISAVSKYFGWETE